MPISKSKNAILVFELPWKLDDKGLMLGSCFAGSKTEKLEMFIEGRKLTWCAAYSSSCYWLQGTMLDCALLHCALNIEDAHYKTHEEMQQAFAEAVAPFAPTGIIGTDSKDQPVALSESLQIVIQPEGRGFRARLSSEGIFERAEEYRLRDEAEEIF